MSNPLSPSLQAFGATFTPAQIIPGQPYWQLVKAEGPMDIGGNVSIFIDVLDEYGKRAVGVPVRFFWNDGQQIKNSEAKPGEDRALDFPIHAKGNSYGIQIADGTPSDLIFGMGLVAWEKHVSYRLVFRRVPGGATGEGPTPPGDDDDRWQKVAALLRAALALVEGR